MLAGVMEPATAALLGIGRSGDVRLVHMVAPTKGDKMEMIDGPAPNGQRVVATLLDSNLPLLPQWAALAAPPHLALFKLHGAMAEPEQHKEFLADLEAMLAESGGALEAAALVPLESDRILADRFSMMRLLEEVTAVVSAAVSSRGARSPAGALPPPPRCCVPRFQDVSADKFAGTLPETVSYPVVVKPRDSSNHSNMALAFDDAGLQHFARFIGTDFRVEEFISHGGRVYKVFVLDEDVYIGERKSLPDVESTDPAALAKLAETVDGTHVRDSEDSVGYLLFDSAVLTKGKEKQGAGLAPAKRLDDQELDQQLVLLLKDSITKRIGTRLFGFDLLVGSATGQYFAVDGNVFPGYKGVEGANTHIRRHLVQRAAQDAVRDDVRRLASDEMVRRVCVATVPDWLVGDDIAVTRMRSHSNHVFQVRNSTPAAEGATPGAKRSDVICRMFGREDFGPEGGSENALVAELSERKLCAGLINCISAEYFGEVVHLGRVEEWLPGRTMADLLTASTTDLPAVAGHIGYSLGGLHALLDTEAKEGGSSNVAQLFSSPLKPKVLSRGKRWRINAMIAVNGSRLQDVAVWQDLHAGFHIVAAEMEPSLMVKVGGSMSSAYSTRIVFGHFDPTPANVVVMGGGQEPTSAELVDFEWAGPNVAVYDFAKFFISMQMRIDQGECSFTEEQLLVAVRSMITRYLEVTAPGAAADAAEVEKFCADVQRYACVVAAVNMFSNLIHASEENLLREAVPATADRWLPGGGFNWLVHASAHMALYFRNKAKA